ncbi:hypothetical protein UlMin_033851 [Ulmus minor]
MKRYNSTTQPVFQKPRTFRLTKLPSMDLPQQNYPAPPIPHPGNTSLVEFPTSPQLIFGEEILHFDHPKHPLSLIDLPDRFTCTGCKEYGSGKRFTCQQCNFQLHCFCASAPPVLKTHPFHCQHQLRLFPKPVKSGMAQSKCDVCNKTTKGYAFRCGACSFQMHPCCAMLSPEISLSVHPHTLRIVPANSATIDSFGCGQCNRKRSGRVYHCTVCDYHLHAVCAKNMVNGLRDNGHNDKDKSSKLGNVVRFASQVAKEFVDGFIQGLAEGFGQVIIQDVARSGTRSSTPTRGLANGRI